MRRPGLSKSVASAIFAPMIGSPDKSVARERVLYCTYWGATEPIGRGNAVPTVIALSQAGYEVYYVTFEKEADVANKAVLKEVSEKLREAGVHWISLPYHKQPAGLSSLIDIGVGFGVSLWLVHRRGIKLVHGRTFVGAAIGALVRSVTNVVLVNHTDGSWPDEQVDNNLWTQNGFAHRLGNAIQAATYRRADAAIVLSRRALTSVHEKRPRLSTTVIQTPVDFNRIPASTVAPYSEGRPFKLVYLGGLGGRYLEKELFEFFACAQELMPSLQIRIVSRTEASKIEEAIENANIDRSRLEYGEVDADLIGPILAESDAGVFMLRQGLSNIWTSATKVAEYWAAGLPVLVTPGCGDLDLLCEEHETGVVLQEFSQDSYSASLKQLVALASHPQIRDRCRELASEQQSIQAIAARHVSVYKRALQNKAGKSR